METSAGSTGFLAAFRALGDGLLGTLQDRLHLLSIELHEEKYRLVQIFIWVSAVVFTGMMTITFASLTLVYIFWESARLFVLLALTCLYAGGLATMVVAFRRYLARQPAPFAASLLEIGQDRSCIPAKN